MECLVVPMHLMGGCMMHVRVITHVCLMMPASLEEHLMTPTSLMEHFVMLHVSLIEIIMMPRAVRNLS